MRQLLRNDRPIRSIELAADTNTIIEPANNNRTTFEIQNIGAADVYLQFGRPAIVGQCFKLTPGSSWFAPVNGMPYKSINVIADGANSKVAVYSDYVTTDIVVTLE